MTFVGSQLLDFDSARSKARKLTEKPSDDPTKLPKVRPAPRSALTCTLSPPSVRIRPSAPVRPCPSVRAAPQAQQELDDAREVFEMLNGQLVAEIPQLLDQRVPYFDPSFEAMIRMQCKFAEEGYEKLSSVQRCAPSPRLPSPTPTPTPSPAPRFPFPSLRCVRPATTG